MKQRFWRWSLALGLGLWLAGTFAAHAQQPAGLRLDKRADADQVSPGSRLSFILTLTNEGADELTGLVVRDATPAGTVFFGAAGSRDWRIIAPQQGQAGNVEWQSTGPLGPGQSATLRLVVTVRASSGETLNSQGFTAQAKTMDQPLTSPAVAVAVVESPAVPASGAAQQASGQAPLWLVIGGLVIAIGSAVVLALGLLRRANQQVDLEVDDA